MNAMIEVAMADWANMNTMLSSFTEEEIKSMLDGEVAGKKRRLFIERLHQRYCKLRMIRERKELLS